MKKIGRLHIFTLILFLFFSVFLFSEITVTAELSDEIIGIGEPFTLTITINGGKADELNIPSNIEGVNLRSTSQSKNFTFNNGRLNTLEKYYYIFTANKKGKYTIEGISVEAKRKVYDIDPLKIEVTENSTRSPSVKNIPSDEEDKYRKNIKLNDIHVENTISKNRVYINEALYISQKAYTKVPVKLLGVSSIPLRNDFFYIADKAEYNSTREIINGVSLSVKPLRKEVLYPLKTGRKNIETTSFVFQIGDGFLNDQIERGGEVFEVEVVPLPKEGKPNKFSGAVGSFNFSVLASEKNIKIGDTIILTVKAEGDGNASVVDIPKIDTNLISNFFTVYTPKIYETNFFNLDKTVSVKSEEYVLVAKDNGNVHIKSINFNYFSPKDKEYKTIVSDDFFINIEGEKSLIQNNNITYIMPIKNKINKDEDSFNIFSSLYFYLYISILLLISISIILFFKLKERKKILYTSRNKINNSELVLNNFESSKNIKSIDSINRKNYLKDIEKLFKNKLSDKLKIKENSELNNIIRTMNEKNIDKEIINKVKNIFNSINEEIYAGNIKEKDYSEEIKYIIDYLENTLK